MLNRNKRNRGLGRPAETKQDFITIALCKCLCMFNLKCQLLHANLLFVWIKEDGNKMTDV